MSRDKKVPKETRPAAPALRAPLAPDYRPGQPLNSLRSDNAAGNPQPDSPPLGGAEGIELRGLDDMALYSYPEETETNIPANLPY